MPRESRETQSWAPYIQYKSKRSHEELIRPATDTGLLLDQ